MVLNLRSLQILRRRRVRMKDKERENEKKQKLMTAIYDHCHRETLCFGLPNKAKTMNSRQQTQQEEEDEMANSAEWW